MPVVETAGGRLRGDSSAASISFRGVPYAAAHRFAPPLPAPGWTGIREAREPGPAAPQPDRPVATFTHGARPRTSEADCLNLNVFTPSLTGSRPVIVWLHGGGFTIGHAGASLYDGARLAVAADVVVVTVNYRLGSFGWLAHPGLAATPDAPAGNWGLLDQTAALEWVRDNVGRFGGNPGQVTVAGQSAGALCALDLLVAPAATGLFRRAIVQSPPFADLAQPPGAAQEWAEALSRAAGGRGEFDLQRLRQLTADQVVELHEALLETPQFRGTRGGALPTLDPATIPVSPAATPASAPHVDVLIGSNAQEGTFFFNSPWRPAPPPERIPAIVSHLAPTAPPDAVLAQYRERAVEHGRPADDLSLLIQIATEAMVAAPAAGWAGARADALGAELGSVHLYRVDHPGAGPKLGATHTAEVPLLFASWSDGGPGARFGAHGPDPAPVSDALIEAWAAFVHGGSPGWSPVAAGADRPEVGAFGGNPQRQRASEVE